MSQSPTPPSDPNAPNPAMVVRRRASVNLREHADASGGAAMDPANQSLADALRITYRILQFGTLALIGVFLLSGFQTVNTNERGVGLRFGAIDNDKLEPGFRFSLPRPLGEIVRVRTSNDSIKLDQDFMPQFRERGDENKPEAELATKYTSPDLNPISDNFLITGDLNIAHARFTVEYRVDPVNVRRYVENVRFGDSAAENNTDQRMVRAAVQRAAVRAAANLTIDEFRKDVQDPAVHRKTFETMESQTAKVAQETLDQFQSGITIVSLKLDRRSVPFRLFNDFNKVEENISAGKTKADAARQERQAILARAAGDAAPLLLRLIDRYDAEYSAGKAAEAEATLAKIDAALDRREIEIDGEKVTPRLGGEVAMRMSEAIQYRSSVVSNAQAAAEAFRSKLTAYRSNPSVFLNGEWANAVATFMSRDSIQTFIVGPDQPLTLWLNRDQDLAKTQERINNEIRARKLAEKNAAEMDASKYKPVKTETSTGQ